MTDGIFLSMNYSCRDSNGECEQKDILHILWQYIQYIIFLQSNKYLFFRRSDKIRLLPTIRSFLLKKLFSLWRLVEQFANTRYDTNRREYHLQNSNLHKLIDNANMFLCTVKVKEYLISECEIAPTHDNMPQES